MGCFDLLHVGHLALLDYCKRGGWQPQRDSHFGARATDEEYRREMKQAKAALFATVVVFLNDDDSVRALKGPDRPVVALNERALMLAAMRDVDLVVPFSGPHPEALIERLRPELLVKGEEYRGQWIAGAEFVTSHGGRVEFAPNLGSSTELLEAIRR